MGEPAKAAPIASAEPIAAAPRPRKYSGADWIRAEARLPVSAFGERCADLIGDWQRGIYHIHRAALNADWSAPRYIEILISASLATFDWNDLTRLVILAHDRAIRVELTPHMRYTKLSMTPRTRLGDWSMRHDSIEDAISRVRSEYGPPPADEVGPHG